MAIKRKLIAKFNNPLAVTPGHTITERLGQHLPVATVYCNLEATDSSKFKTIVYAELFVKAPEMHQDIANFCAAMAGCRTQSEAAKIAKDYHALFRQHI